MFEAISGRLYFCHEVGFKKTVIHPLGYDENSKDQSFEIRKIARKQGMHMMPYASGYSSVN